MVDNAFIFQNPIQVATILKRATIEYHTAVWVNAVFQNQSQVTMTFKLTIAI